MTGRINPVRITAALVLGVLWVLLQGELSWANLAAAILVVGAVLVVLPPGRASAGAPRPLGIVRFVLTVLRSLVTSSWAVMVATFRPTPDRCCGSFVDVVLHDATPLSMTLVANAISVTPGTITLESSLADDGTAHLSVHVLGKIDPAEFQRDTDALHDLARGTFRAHGSASSAATAGGSR